jgi:hypothetical protein
MTWQRRHRRSMRHSDRQRTALPPHRRRHRRVESERVQRRPQARSVAIPANTRSKPHSSGTGSRPLSRSRSRPPLLRPTAAAAGLQFRLAAATSAVLRGRCSKADDAGVWGDSTAPIAISRCGCRVGVEHTFCLLPGRSSEPVRGRNCTRPCGRRQPNGPASFRPAAGSAAIPAIDQETWYPKRRRDRTTSNAARSSAHRVGDERLATSQPGMPAPGLRTTVSKIQFASVISRLD